LPLLPSTHLPLSSPPLSSFSHLFPSSYPSPNSLDLFVCVFVSFGCFCSVLGGWCCLSLGGCSNSVLVMLGCISPWESCAIWWLMFCLCFDGDGSSDVGGSCWVVVLSLFCTYRRTMLGHRSFLCQVLS
ncbi:unnamed protein product, partial [Prunus brigantina]